MTRKHFFVMFVLSFVFVFSFQAFSQKTSDQKNNQIISGADVQLSSNDRLVMHVMRTLHSAEMAFSAVFGAGNYGSLEQLAEYDLVDASIASGEKYGYRFTVSRQFPTAMTPPSFEIKAVPVIRRPRKLSFYLNETCEIRGADKLGREATVNDPIIEPCGASPRAGNESAAISSMRTIHGAQMTYQATSGAGEYGTLAELYDANVIRTGFALVSIYRGYSCTMIVTRSTPSTPARFTLKVVPTEYGRTGIRSFYMDESGVLRGADKQGLPADENDPPVED